MRRINPLKIPDFIHKDIGIVKKEARIVLKISSDEKIVEITENKNPRLNIIAIIGPSWGFGREWQEVVLAEIGISRTRPYHEALGLNRKPDESYIHYRRKWFDLSPFQYQLVAPIVFGKLQAIAFKKVISWKKGPFSNDEFGVLAIRHWWLRGKKRLVETDYFVKPERGARFSVSLKDEFFVRDIYWGELNLNRSLKRYLNGLVNFIDLRLNWYRYSYKGKISFRKLKGALEVEEILRRKFLVRRRHLLIEIVRRLKEEKKNAFWQHIAEMINWNGEENQERKMVSLACSHPDLPHPRTRLGNIQLQVTTGLEKKKDYIVFEVFPRKK